MDEITSCALEQIAIEGKGGCSLPTLWALVTDELPIQGVKKVVDPIKSVIWKGILKRPHDVVLYTKLETAQKLGASFAPPEGELPSNDLTEMVALSEPGTCLQSFQHAELNQVRVVASEMFREVVLGLFDAKTCRFKVSDKQYDALDLIAQARKKGVLQAELAKELAVAHRNFFFVSKSLESRGLIVKNPIIVCRGENHSVSAHSATSILHLKRYAPNVKLQPFQLFRMIEGTTDCSLQPGEATYRLRDDSRWMQTICAKISESEDRVVMEHELKVSLGFRKTKGHRLWRRLKMKMMDSGLLDVFIGSVDGRPVTCVKLLTDFDTWMKEQRAKRERNLTGGPEAHVVVESTLDRQIFAKIVEAGPEGITTKDIFRMFRLNSKNNAHRINNMKKRYNVHIRCDNVGKSFVNRCIAPVNTENFGNIQQPATPQASLSLPPPEGGWMSAVARAIQAGQDGDETVNPPLPPPPGQSPTLISNNRALVSIDSPAPPATISDDKTLRQYLFTHVIGSRSDYRLQRLVEKLNKDRFIVQSHIKAYIRDEELAAGLKNMGKGPDRKTIERLLDRLVAKTGAQKIMVSVLSKRGGELKLMDVVVHPDVEITEGLLKEIREVNSVFDRVIRQRSHIRVCAEAMEARGEEIPVMDKITRLLPERFAGEKAAFLPLKIAPAEQGEAFAQMHDNGFITAKMVRVKLLHYLVCRMVGLGGFAPALQPEEDTPKDARFPRWRDRTTTEPMYPGAPDPEFVFTTRVHEEKETACVHVNPAVLVSDTGVKYKFTPRQLWDFMPIDLFMQIVGTSTKFEGLEELCGQSKIMSQLPEERQRKVIDGSSRGRLSDLLDVLGRMGLIESIVAASTSCLGLQECSKFAVHAKGLLEEPVSQDAAGGQSGSSTFVKQTHEYDLTKAEELDVYWTRLQYVFTSKRENARLCFPANRAPEVCSRTGWITNRLMSMGQWLQLVNRMDVEKDQLDWSKCQEIARDLNLSYHQVLQLSYERRRRHRLERLRAGEPLEPRQRIRRTPRAQPKKPKRKRARNRKPSQKKSTGRKRVAKRSRIKKLSRHRTLPIFPGVSNEVQSDMHFTDAELLMGMEDEGALTEAIVPPRVRTRTGYWEEEEDEQLLSAFFAWRCSARPPKSGPRWVEMVGLPCSQQPFGVARCKRRFTYLRKNQECFPLVKKMESLADKIYIMRVSRLERKEKRPNPMKELIQADQGHSEQSKRQKMSLDDGEDKETQGDGMSQGGIGFGDDDTEHEEVSVEGNDREPTEEPEAPPPFKRQFNEQEVASIVRRVAEASGPLAPPKPATEPSPEASSQREKDSGVSAGVESAKVHEFQIEDTDTPDASKDDQNAGPDPANDVDETDGAEMVIEGGSNEREIEMLDSQVGPSEEEAMTRTVEIDDVQTNSLELEVAPLTEANRGHADDSARQERPGSGRALKGIDALEILSRNCHPEDRELVMELRRLVSETAKKAPRAVKHLNSKVPRVQQLMGIVVKARMIPESLGSSIVSSQPRNKRFSIRLGRSRLLSDPGPVKFAVAAAKDYILSLMFLSEKNEYLTKPMAIALTQRFTDEEIFKALGLLNKQGWVNPGNARRPLQLSLTFRLLKVDDLPEGLITDAVEAEVAFSNLGQKRKIPRKHPLLKYVNRTGVLSLAEGSNINGGTLASLLAGMAEGKLDVRADVSFEKEKAKETEKSSEGISMLGPISPSIALQIVSPDSVVDDTAVDNDTPGPSQRTNAQKKAKAGAKRSFQDLLEDSERSKKQDTFTHQFPPSKVACSETLRQEAESAFATWAKENEESSCVEDAIPLSEVSNECLKLLRLGGEGGVKLGEALEHLEVNPDDECSVEVVAKGFEGMCMFGLARCLPGYDEERYFAVEHSQRFVLVKEDKIEVEEQPEEPPPVAKKGRKSVGSKKGKKVVEDRQQEQQKVQGVVVDEVQLRPWLDHEGKISGNMLKLLQERVFAAVMRNPGIPEQDLIQKINFVNPQNAVGLLNLMVHQKVLQVKKAQIVKPTPPALFGPKKSEKAVKVFYFPNLARCFDKGFPVVEKVHCL